MAHMFEAKVMTMTEIVTANVTTNASKPVEGTTGTIYGTAGTKRIPVTYDAKNNVWYEEGIPGNARHFWTADLETLYEEGILK